MVITYYAETTTPGTVARVRDGKCKFIAPTRTITKLLARGFYQSSVAAIMESAVLPIWPTKSRHRPISSGRVVTRYEREAVVARDGVQSEAEFQAIFG